MFDKIKIAIKEGTLLTKVWHKIKSRIAKFLLFFIKRFAKINNNQILFLTFQGSYTCNPRAIADEIIKEKLPYKLYWAVRKENLENLEQYPKELIIVKRGSFKFHMAVATSKILIDNSTGFAFMNLKKRKGQIVLQTWHGSLGFKRLDPDSVRDKEWVKKAQSIADVTDYVLTNSTFEEDVFRGSYWPNTPLLKYGHTRNDMLFNKHGEFKKYNDKIRKLYGIDKDTKIALYAPTFREDYSFESYDLDYNKLKEALEKRFGGKWIIMVRFHFRLRKFEMPKKYLKNVINVTNYGDMQELLCVCDLGITDYSSWLCDFVLTKKPGFLYASDIDKYANDERGFYYPLSSTPFPLAKSNNELYNKLLNFDEKKYKKDVNAFLKRLGCYEKGDASKKVVEKIKELIK